MAPRSASDFLTQSWGRHACVAHGSRERLPVMMHDRAFASPSALAHAYNGRVRFTGGGSERMAMAVDVPPSTLQDMGLTLQFVDIAHTVPGTHELLRQLETELGVHEGAVSISAFTSPVADGLPVHYDAQDLISVQLRGSKQFHYAPVTELVNPCGSQFTPTGPPFDDLYPQVGNGFPDPRHASFSVAAMVPGTVLYLPRGTWHHTSASEDSLSLSIMIDTPPALRSLLDQLRLVLLQDPEWRAPMYGMTGDTKTDTAVRMHLADMIARLPQLLARIKPDDVLEAPARADRRLRRLGIESRFQRTPNARLQITPSAMAGVHTILLQLGHTTSLTVPMAQADIVATTVPLLHWIDAQIHGPFTAQELQRTFPDVPFATLKEVLELCVKAQYLRLLWFPALLP
ncbi:MAG: cupin domain-containing protein [Betaproteobacteria bacterium]